MLIEKYPFLNELINLFEKKKLILYLEDDVFLDIHLEYLIEELWNEANSLYDLFLSKNISLEERYNLHRQLEFDLNQSGYYASREFRNNWMMEEYDFPSEFDDDAHWEKELINPHNPWNSLIENNISIEELGL
jgi:hypothetical protein